jgi:hypothetical protein
VSEKLAIDDPTETASRTAGAGPTRHGAAAQTQSTADRFVRFVREQPLAAVLSALIVGYVLGKII